MKKIILLVLVTLMMVGCNNQPDYQRINKWQILELDSCEYIRADGVSGPPHPNAKLIAEPLKEEFIKRGLL